MAGQAGAARYETWMTVQHCFVMDGMTGFKPVALLRSSSAVKLAPAAIRKVSAGFYSKSGGGTTWRRVCITVLNTAVSLPKRQVYGQRRGHIWISDICGPKE